MQIFLPQNGIIAVQQPRPTLDRRGGALHLLPSDELNPMRSLGSDDRTGKHG